MRKILFVSMLCFCGTAAGLAQNPNSKSIPVKATTHIKAEKQKLKPRLQNIMKAQKGEKILAQKVLRKNVMMKIVEDAQGRIYKVIDKPGNRSLKYPQRNKSARQTDNDYISFYESFEGWTDSYGLNWIPDGWEEKNTKENAPTEEMLEHNVNNSWYAYYTGDGYWLPITPDGEKDMFIHFTYSSSPEQSVQFTAAPQDEWLITPTVSVKEGQKLFFDSSVDLSSTMELDWNTMEYNRDVMECDLEVHVSADNGATWTRLWSAMDDVAKMLNDYDLYEAGLQYRNYSIDLKDYAGKNVKIAFRYLNAGSGNDVKGNSLSIDAVTIGKPMPEANYNLPYGSLLSGLSEDFWIQNSAIAVMPAYTDIEWVSSSNSYTAENKWTFESGETDGEDITMTGDNVTMQYPYTTVVMPTLTASNENGSGTYTWGQDDKEQAYIMSGGNIIDEQGIEYGLGNYDFIHHHFTTPYFMENSYCFGTGSDEAWGAKLIGIGNVFEKPAAPLFTDRAFLTLEVFDADPDAEFDVNIYEIDSYGYTGEMIAHGKATAKDVYAEDGLYTLPFDLYKASAAEEEQKADRAQTPGVEINQDVLVEITGFADNAKVRHLAAMAQADNHASGKNFAYLNFEFTNTDGSTSTLRYSASEVMEDYNSSLILSLRGAFSFMTADKNNIILPAEGGSETVRIMSFYEPSVWLMNYGGKDYTLDKPVTIDWLTIEPDFNKETKEATVTFRADRAKQAQGKSITINARGAQQTFAISQSAASGIDNVTNEDAPSISTDGNTVKITCKDMAGKKATMFGTDGKAAGNAQFDSNSTATFNTSSLPKGIYMIKAGEKTVKIMK